MLIFNPFWSFVSKAAIDMFFKSDKLSIVVFKSKLTPVLTPSIIFVSPKISKDLKTLLFMIIFLISSVLKSEFKYWSKSSKSLGLTFSLIRYSYKPINSGVIFKSSNFCSKLTSTFNFFSL